MYASGSGTISTADLPFSPAPDRDLSGRPSKPSLKTARNAAQIAAIHQALTQTGYNKAKAARVRLFQARSGHRRSTGTRNTKQATKKNRAPKNPIQSPDRTAAATKKSAEMMNRPHPQTWHFFSNPVTMSSLNLAEVFLLMGSVAKSPGYPLFERRDRY
jgi:hypothetical protein